MFDRDAMLVVRKRSSLSSTKSIELDAKALFLLLLSLRLIERDRIIASTAAAAAAATLGITINT